MYIKLIGGGGAGSKNRSRGNYPRVWTLFCSFELLFCLNLSVWTNGHMNYFFAHLNYFFCMWAIFCSFELFSSWFFELFFAHLNYFFAHLNYFLLIWTIVLLIWNIFLLIWPILFGSFEHIINSSNELWLFELL